MADKKDPRLRSYQLMEGIVCGCYPFRYVQELIDMYGINVFLDLTVAGEHSHLLAEPLRPYEQLLPPNVTHIRAATANGKAGSQDWLQQTADLLHHFHDEGNVVYVHCHAGIGRTGMAIMSYMLKWKKMHWDDARHYIQAARVVMFDNYTAIGMNEPVIGFRPSPRKPHQLEALWQFYCNLHPEINTPRVQAHKELFG